MIAVYVDRVENQKNAAAANLEVCFQEIPFYPETSAIAKDIGHRQVYDILQCRNPRATGAALWGFGVFAVAGDSAVACAHDQT